MWQVKVNIAPELIERLGGDIVVNITTEHNVSIVRPASPQNPPLDGETTSGDGDVLDYMERYALAKAANGQKRTAETYTSTLRRLSDFLRQTGYGNEPHLEWRELTADLMVKFDNYMRHRGLVDNTRSFYFRRLRAIANQARKEGEDVAPGLFDDVYTGIAKTVKRALTVGEIRRIVKLDLENEDARRARDLFVFSFLTRGMSMIDIAHLTRKNISNNLLTYTRRKTGQTLHMEWTADMERIATLYNKVGNRYLLSLIDDDDEGGCRQYRNMQYQVNYYLRRIGRSLKLHIPLTMYVARHSWATIAKSVNVPTAVISDALGHNSERTTQIYLDNIDTGRIDKVNRSLARKVLGTDGKSKVKKL